MKLTEIKNTDFLAKGHRGVLYKGNYKGRSVVIKTKRKESEAIGRIENEANFLKKLNEKGIGPELIYYNKKKDFMVYYYVDGEFFPIVLEHSKNPNQIKKILKQVFLQCYKMDKMGIDKEEMHHPYKHILIDNKTKKPVMIDFERCHHVEIGKNVTQFCTYIISEHISKQLLKLKIKVNRDKIINAAKRYKKDQIKKNFDKILLLLKLTK